MKKHSYLFLAAFLAASSVPVYPGTSSKSLWSLEGITSGIASCVSACQSKVASAFSFFSTEARVAIGGLATLMTAYMGYKWACSYGTRSSAPDRLYKKTNSKKQDTPLLSDTTVVSSTTDLQKYFLRNKVAKEARIRGAELAARERRIEKRAVKVLVKKRENAEKARIAQEKAEQERLEARRKAEEIRRTQEEERRRAAEDANATRKALKKALENDLWLLDDEDDDTSVEEKGRVSQNEALERALVDGAWLSDDEDSDDEDDEIVDYPVAKTVNVPEDESAEQTEAQFLQQQEHEQGVVQPNEDAISEEEKENVSQSNECRAKEAALREAVFNGDIQKVEELVGQGTNVNASGWYDSDLFSDDVPLDIAFKKGHVRLIGILLRYGAIFKDYGDVSHDTIKTRIREICRRWDTEYKSHPNIDVMFASLVKHFSKKNNDDMKEWLTDSLKLACDKNATSLVKVLSKNRINPNARVGGGTLLTQAVSDEKLDIVDALLAAGADANSRDRETKRTVLIQACIDGDLSMVELLLNHGADPTLDDGMAYNIVLNKIWNKDYLSYGEMRKKLEEAAIKMGKPFPQIVPVQQADIVGALQFFGYKSDASVEAIRSCIDKNMSGIKRTYRRLMFENHPDKNKTSQAVKNAEHARKSYELIHKTHLFVRKMSASRPEVCFRDVKAPAQRIYSQLTY